MAKEEDDDRYAALALEFDRINTERKLVTTHIEKINRRNEFASGTTPDQEVEAAMSLLNNISRLAEDDAARAEFNPLIKQLGEWIGLSFREGIKGKKRVIRKLQYGHIVFGGGPLPVPLYGHKNCDYSSIGMECPMIVQHPDSARSLAVEQDAVRGPNPEQEKAGPIYDVTGPAMLRSERSAKGVESQPEGISFTKGSRGDRRCTFPNDISGMRIFQLAIAQSLEFTSDTFFALGSSADRGI